MTEMLHRQSSKGRIFASASGFKPYLVEQNFLATTKRLQNGVEFLVPRGRRINKFRNVHEDIEIPYRSRDIFIDPWLWRKLGQQQACWDVSKVWNVIFGPGAKSPSGATFMTEICSSTRHLLAAISRTTESQVSRRKLDKYT